MASIPPTQSNQPRSIKKSMHQKQGRRKSSLMKRASEYSKMCDADVCVGIRLRETGQVFILSADTSGFWAFLSSQLVCLQLCLWWKDNWPIKNSYYPAPKLVIDPDLEQVDKDTSEQHTWSCATRADLPPDQTFAINILFAIFSVGDLEQPLSQQIRSHWGPEGRGGWNRAWKYGWHGWN